MHGKCSRNPGEDVWLQGYITYFSMKVWTACSSTEGMISVSDGGLFSQERGFLSLMPAASPGASAEGSEFERDQDRREAASTDLLRFLADGCEAFELGGDSACNARPCSITLPVSYRKMMEASSRYPSQTSLRLMHRRHEGRPSSQRTRRCLQRRHPRLKRTIGVNLALRE